MTKSVHVFGLTGGMGSGKSVVSGMLAKHGLKIVDADQITRMVHQDPDVHSQLVEAFGQEIICDRETPHSSINRAVLGKIAFSSPENLNQLNAIMQPALASRVESVLCKESGLVVLDAPLLFEANWDRFAEQTITVVCPMELRIQRIHARDGLPQEQIQARIQAQMSDAQRIYRSDYLIYNVGTLTQLQRQVDRLIIYIKRNCI